MDLSPFNLLVKRRWTFSIDSMSQLFHCTVFYFILFYCTCTSLITAGK